MKEIDRSDIFGVAARERDRERQRQRQRQRQTSRISEEVTNYKNIIKS